MASKLLLLTAFMLSILARSEAQVGPRPTLSCSRRVDIAYLVDVTHSMRPYIKPIRDASSRIARAFRLTRICLRQAFVGYHDRYGRICPTIPRPTSPDFEFKLRSFTSSSSSFQSFLRGIRTEDGGDCPEDVFGGLEQATLLNWDRNAARRILFHIADAPAHGKQYGGCGCYPDGSPRGLYLTDMMKRLRDDRVTYIFGRINAASTDKMVKEFSSVLGSPIIQYNVAAPGAIPGRSCCRQAPNDPPPSDRKVTGAVHRGARSRSRRRQKSAAELMVDALKAEVV